MEAGKSASFGSPTPVFALARHPLPPPLALRGGGVRKRSFFLLDSQLPNRWALPHIHPVHSLDSPVEVFSAELPPPCITKCGEGGRGGGAFKHHTKTVRVRFIPFPETQNPVESALSQLSQEEGISTGTLYKFYRILRLGFWPCKEVASMSWWGPLFVRRKSMDTKSCGFVRVPRIFGKDSLLSSTPPHRHRSTSKSFPSPCDGEGQCCRVFGSRRGRVKKRPFSSVTKTSYYRGVCPRRRECP